ncbi:SDR family oxidoreductase [Natronorubrum daqingense]|uniref:NAD(P)-dependent dehydrogenase, short-chain alcohol dehydrogenase family n=1 Tax=Natronorubrum daqingense TaxID=588898 RepID=A0A1N7C021_9EURY|nr:SDR family oxidoreductase [Natronorubrum daqingense]APX96673.1 NAD(P)-dependent oxidoreductase [Natronorubrum daqingense]SIR56915.1 NAD(P)-dependent dehydrogenase, short-chain alcohol dehydrogenase family [Natronorubrum daqingense]
MTRQHPRETAAEIEPQEQNRQPGLESEMEPPAEFIRDDYEGSGKLEGKVAVVTGGDSGIGRAAAVHFAREGADVAVMYLDEEEDAETTAEMVEDEGQASLTLAGDVRDSAFCQAAVEEVVDEFGDLNVVVNNAAAQVVKTDLTDISDEQWEETFATNIHGYFYLTKAALPHLEDGDTIVNTTSINAFRGHDTLVDYSTTKGAIVAFTRSLSQQLAPEGIRVNQVAPGPIWTPLIPATIGQYDPEMVESFGEDVPMGRPGQPSELGPAYVYLACEDSSYVSGQTLHVNGGSVIGG